MAESGERTERPDEHGGGREAEVLQARRDSLERLRELGVEPFALTYEPSATVAEIRERHGSLGEGASTDDDVAIAGRVVQRRDFGKLTFLVVRDRTGDLQAMVVKGDLDATQAAVADEIDLGDIVGIRGTVGTSKKGELQVKASDVTMLTKSLRPLPEKWHGLKDPDLQQRHRYVHLIADEMPRRYAHARAVVLKTLRRVLDEQDYTEFEGPMLQQVAGGANARPFTTYHNVLDTEMKLRISLELYLKRMLVGGAERVFELGRNFRNEGIDRDHNPEFTMLEAYRAYGDYHDMMRLSEALIVESARAVNPIFEREPGDLRLPYRDLTIDLTTPFAKITILGSVSEAVGREITLETPDLAGIAAQDGVHIEESWGPGKIIQELFEKLVEPTIEQPTFVCDFPREVSPLARPHRDNPRLTEHFDLVIGGLELVTAFSELTDPDEQRAKFEDQVKAKQAGDEEAHPLDEDFLRALEHGMPPAGGLGLGIDRLLMLLTDAPSLRDLIMFPSQRPEAES